MILLAGYKAGVPIFEYTLQVKQAVVGYGLAENQVIDMVARTPEGSPKPDDAADALAIALVMPEALPRYLI